jgi:hypothetical protein
MDRKTQAKEAWIVIPENEPDNVVLPGLLQETRPLEEMLAIEVSVNQEVFAVTSVVVPSE